MAGDFQEAFTWHMERFKPRTVDLERETGVSRHVINKLKARDGSSTSVDNAILIAAYFGKTVNQFLLCENVTPVQTLQTLFELLESEEQQLFLAQMRGVLQQRA